MTMYVCVFVGVDLTANQDEVTDRETFQVEYCKKAQQWRIRTSEDKYWSLEHASGIQGVGNDRYIYLHIIHLYCRTYSSVFF